MTEVAIIGAGPYALSLAAHLKARAVSFRIFGPPMRSWSEHMPAGMCLKSDGFASDLYDAERSFTLERFCAERGIAYDHLKIPVHLETFVAYGRAFQARMVPSLEENLVVSVRSTGAGFELKLDNGTLVQARRVVVASGIAHLEQLPEELAPLGPQLCTHTSAHSDLSGFAGKKVVVLGGGSSAIDIAALLHRAGAAVEVVTRRPVKWSEGPGDGRRSLWQRIRKPHVGLGSSFRSTMYALFPNLFHHLPRSLRLRIVRRHLGPLAAWFVRPQFDGVVPLHVGYSLKEARAAGTGAELRFANAAGQDLVLRPDHVICGTGYRISVAELPFIDRALLSGIEVEERSPVLSRHFESSVPGLYFIGLLSANSFGPLMRFALGANFSASSLAAHLARVCPRVSEQAQSLQSTSG
jgi:cation diffusion facilitator CzcD-associated flavoprotein CzcO